MTHWHPSYTSRVDVRAQQVRRGRLALPTSYQQCPVREMATHLLHPLAEILLVWRVLDDRDHECIEIAQRSTRAHQSHPLDHLLMRDPELLPWPKQRHHHRMLRMRMNACTGVTKRVGVVEEGSASGLFERLVHRPAEERAILQSENKDVAGLDTLLLHARGRDEDLFAKRDPTSVRCFWERNGRTLAGWRCPRRCR